MTTIFESLDRAHADVEDGFRAIHAAHAANQPEQAREGFRELSTKLLALLHAEHTVVYPSFAYHAGLADEVARAIREHDEIVQVIDHLRLVRLAPQAWQGALTRLHLLVAEHVETEAWILFPVARLRLSPARSARLADELAAHLTRAAPTAGCSITYDPPCVDDHRDATPRAVVPERTTPLERAA